MALEEAGVKLVAEGESAFFGAMDRAEKSVRGFSDSVEGSSGKVNIAQAAITGAFTAISGVVLDVMAGAGKAVLNFVGDSITAAGDFEAGMGLFEAAAGKSLGAAGLDAEAFRDVFLDIGKRLPVSTLEVQDAATTLVKGGLDPLILKMGGLEDSIKFAAAAGLDLNSAAEISIKMLSSFVPITADAEEQTRFLAESQELLVKAAGASTGDVDKLSDAVLVSAGQAKAAGLEYEDFITTMTLVGDQFPSAAEAGTSFKNLLTSLQPKTKKQTEAMAELGLITEEGTSVFYDANGQFIGMRDTSQRLQDAFIGLTDAQRSHYTSVIFGNDAMGAANTLIDAGAKGYDIYTQKIAEANGVQAQYEATLKGYNAAQNNVEGSLDVLSTTIGTYVLPLLTDLFNNVIAPAIDTVTEFAEAFFTSADKVAFLGDALGLQLPSIYDVETALAHVGAVVVPLVEGAVEDLEAIFSQAFTAVESIVASAMGYVQSVLGVAATFIANNGDSILGFIQTTWEKVSVIIGKAVELISAVITTVFNFVAQFINEHGDKIVAFLTAAWDVIKTVIDAALAIIESVIKIALAVIEGDWQTVWDEIVKLTDTLLHAIYDIIEKVIELVKTVIDLGLAFIENLFRDAWEKIKNKAQSDWQQIKDAIEGALNDVKRVAEGVVNDIVGFFNTLPSKLSQAASNAMQALIDALMARISAIRQAVQDILNAIANIDLNPFDGYSGSFFGGVNATPTTDQVYGNGKNLPPNSTSYARNYNLAVHTMQSSGSVIRDFAIMEALAG